MPFRLSLLNLKKAAMLTHGALLLTEILRLRRMSGSSIYTMDDPRVEKVCSEYHGDLMWAVLTPASRRRQLKAMAYALTVTHSAKADG